MGLALEIAQLFILGRAFEWSDLAADSCGVITGLILGQRFRAKTRERKAQTPATAPLR